MTTFTNGPAKGSVLSLRRAPLFLRAVQDAKGNWDALDQIDDKPKSSETVTVYRLVENRGMIHICSRSKGKNTGGYFAMASYELHDEQPGDEIVRDTSKWQEWCKAHAEDWVQERAARRTTNEAEKGSASS